MKLVVEMSCVIDCEKLSLREANSRIKEAVHNGNEAVLTHASELYGLASGLKNGEVTVRGNAGDYLGALNQGARIVVEGDAGAFVGDNSRDGEIWVKGNVGEGLGMYAYGGVIVVSGDAGNAVAQMNKGGTIVIGGSVGDNVGLYMMDGRVVICGNAGKGLGHVMLRGAIYLDGALGSLGKNSEYEGITDGDLAFLRAMLEKYGLRANMRNFKKIVPASSRP